MEAVWRTVIGDLGELSRRGTEDLAKLGVEHGAVSGRDLYCCLC